jgi:hypothetical protein
MELNCQHTQEAILEHLTEGSHLSVSCKTHLDSCEICQTYFAEMSFIFNTNSSEPEQTVAEDYFNKFWSNLEPKLEPKKAPFITKFFTLSTLNYAAAAIILISSGYFLADWNINKNISQKTLETAINDPLVKDKELRKVIHQSNILLTSFNGMDQYSASDLLKEFTLQAESLNGSLNNLREKYQYDSDLQQILKEVQQILTLIVSLKDENIGNVKAFQYGLKRKDIVKKLQQIEI